MTETTNTTNGPASMVDDLKSTLRESYNSDGVDDVAMIPPAAGAAGSSSVPPSNTGFSKAWTKIVKTVHKPIMAVVLFLTTTSSRRPKQAILSVVTLSIALIVVGIFTNFNVDVDENVLWTPMGSKPIQYMNWITDESNFPVSPRYLVYFFHANGNNVIGQDHVQRVFEAIDVVRDQQVYKEVCAKNGTKIVAVDDSTGEVPEKTCDIFGVVQFWNTSTEIFETTVSSDQDVIEAVSEPTFPDGRPVAVGSVMGNVERDPTTDLITSALSFTVYVALPDVEEIEEPELDFVDSILALNTIWANRAGYDGFRVECQAQGSFGSEFSRAIVNDIPLIPIVFVIMSVFTCLVFVRRHKVHSRALLGFLLVVSVFLSIMSGYGLMFVSGVPFTSMTQILPFVVFGVGLDDGYIIMGSYLRTDTRMSPEDRIRVTIEEVGISITLTTLTSVTAFALGCSSSIPAVYWLCLYAFPTIALVWLYQLTFVVACIVLDERRIIANKRDCLVCFQVNSDNDENDDDVAKNTVDTIGSNQEETMSAADRFMVRYANFLLHPVSKIVVVISAVTICGFSAWSATKLTQEFKFTDVLPSDSYITDFVAAENLYTQRGTLQVGVYFRDVDQSDPDIQRQMEDYVNDLVGMESITEQPDHFWLRDLKEFSNSTLPDGLDFDQQFTAFMNNSVYSGLYSDHIVRDPESGKIVSSRVFVSMDNVDVEDVAHQIDVMKEQNQVTDSQPINVGSTNYAFFNYDGIHNIWEFYTVSVNELIVNTILGVVTVSVLGFILIPHWTATLYVFPVTCMMYVDILGFMQWLGVHINAVSYVSLVMSIGLVVDFVMHVVLRYFECPGTRREKTVEMLRTMGVSVLIGGVSTFLGTLPLAFSSSEIFTTIFVVFLALVIFGTTHALILLPVLLSTFGAEEQISTSIVEHKYDQPEQHVATRIVPKQIEPDFEPVSADRVKNPQDYGVEL